MGLNNVQLFRHLRELAVTRCVVLIAVLALQACAGPNEPAIVNPDKTDSGAQADAGGSSACAAHASSCPSSCLEMGALRLREEQRCKGPREVVGCRQPPVTTSDGPCFRRTADGSLFLVEGSYGFQGREGWERCSATETAMFNGLDLCPR